MLPGFARSRASTIKSIASSVDIQNRVMSGLVICTFPSSSTWRRNSGMTDPVLPTTLP